MSSHDSSPRPSAKGFASVANAVADLGGRLGFGCIAGLPSSSRGFGAVAVVPDLVDDDEPPLPPPSPEAELDDLPGSPEHDPAADLLFAPGEPAEGGPLDPGLALAVPAPPHEDPGVRGAVDIARLLVGEGDVQRHFNPEVARLLLQMATAPGQSDLAAQADSGISRNKMPRLASVLASTCLQLQRHRVEHVLGGLTREVIAQGGQALLYLESVRGDETPLKGKAAVAGETVARDTRAYTTPLVPRPPPRGTTLAPPHTPSSPAKERCGSCSCCPQVAPPDLVVVVEDVEAPGSEVAPAEVLDRELTKLKMVQTEWTGALLFRLEAKHIVVVFPLLSHLQCVDTTTGETYHECFSRVGAPEWGFLDSFERKVRISTSDQDGAIERAERSRASKFDLVRVPCHIHIAAAMLKKAGAILDFDVTGMVHLSLALNTPGAMPGFRKALRQVLAKRLRVCVGHPPPAATRANSTLLDLLFEGCGPYDPVRRAVIESMANGDWSSRQFVDTWVSGPKSHRSQLHLFQTKWVQAVCGAAPRVYPRHRWTGAEDTMRWILVLHCCGGLLLDTLELWIGRGPARAATGPAAPRPGDSADREQGDLGEGEGGAGCDGGAAAAAGGNLGSEVMLYDPAVANAAQDVIQQLQRETRTWKRTALDWAGSEGSAARLLIFRRVQEGQRRVIRDLLKLGGDKWECAEAYRELKRAQAGDLGHSARRFRISEAAAGRRDMVVVMECYRIQSANMSPKCERCCVLL